MSYKTTISIIMPVYNGEAYLKDSLNSLLNQSYTNFELLAIDDGSTDNSYNVLLSYAEIDNRIKPYTIQNNGPGNALNFGINKASGKYLCFIDQDDFIDTEHLDSLIHTVQKNKTPVALCQARYCAENGHIQESINYLNTSNAVLDNTSLKSKNSLSLNYVPQWTKIIDIDFWKTHKLEFPGQHNKAHDVPINVLIMFFSDYLSFTMKETYFHRIHDKQITSTDNFSMVDGFINSFIDIINYCNKNNIKNNKLKKYAVENLLFIGKHRTLKQRLKIIRLCLQYAPTMSIKRLFYSKKYKKNHKAIRALFFKFKFPKKEKTLQLYRPKIRLLGKNTYSYPDIIIANKNETSIGSFCSIGKGVVLGHGIHPTHFLTTSPFLYFDKLGYKLQSTPSHNEYWHCPPINIGNDVWIGDYVYIKNGITIGDGAVIGARSVVTKNVPPYAIVVGSPAKIIKYRFDEKTISDLLSLKWWDLPDQTIKSIPYDNIEKSLKYLKEDF
jgi:acetyltransferase-like isoleucine patch superfamily enzyme